MLCNDDDMKDSGHIYIEGRLSNPNYLKAVESVTLILACFLFFRCY